MYCDKVKNNACVTYEITVGAKLYQRCNKLNLSKRFIEYEFTFPFEFA